MLDYLRENQKLVSVILAIGIIAVIFVAMFLLIIVWTPDKVKVDKDDNKGQIISKLGTYELVNVTEKEMIQNCCNEILNIFGSGDMNQIQDIILPEYLEFRGVTKHELEKLLIKKGFFKKILKFTSYKTIYHPKYGKVHEINISSYDNMFSDKMLIIQKAPNNYKVSFDGFIGLDKEVKTFVKDGIKLEIKEIKELITIIDIKLSLTNVSGHNIIINQENNYEIMYLKLTTASEIRLNSVWLSGEEITLTDNNVVNLNAEFLTSGFDSGVGKSIVIKNIYDTLSKELKEIEFPIY